MADTNQINKTPGPASTAEPHSSMTHASPGIKKITVEFGKDGGSSPSHNAPAHYMSPYMFFAQEERHKLMRELNGIGFGSIGITLNERWNALDDEQRGRFIALSDQDKKRYEEEMAAFKMHQMSIDEPKEDVKSRS